MDAAQPQPTRTFAAAPETRLQSRRLYLVRPDGFVAAEAVPSDAAKIFTAILTAMQEQQDGARAAAPSTGCARRSCSRPARQGRCGSRPPPSA